MTKCSIAAIVLVLSVASPALAEESPSNAGLPAVNGLGTVARGQPSYVFDPSGRLVDLQRQADRAREQQLAGAQQADSPLGRTELPVDYREATP